MTRNPRLDEAVAIFKELGWADASYADAPTLPLGTPAQRKVALAGLRSGQWSEWNTHTHADDIVMLALFAVRVGVDARRAAEVLRCAGGLRETPGGDHVLTAVLLERGPVFAEGFVARVERQMEYAEGLGSRFPVQVVQLVAHHGLDIPRLTGYLQDWSYLALLYLTGDTFVEPRARDRPSRRARPTSTRSPVGGRGHRQGVDPDRPSLGEGPVETIPGEVQLGLRENRTVIRDRFVEHVQVGVAIGARPDGPFGRVLTAGVAQGWLGRDQAMDLVLPGLEATARPMDRKTWLSILFDTLGAGDGDVVARVDALVPVLATGDSYVIERLAPMLVTGVTDDVLPDVVMAALTATTKKALGAVLEALAARPRPSSQTLKVLVPQIRALGRDRSSARAVQSVLDAWGLAEEVLAEPTEGLWRAVPPVWTPPRFDHGEETAEALTQAAAELSARRGMHVVDVAVERFLALANAVARHDPDLARTALAGVRDTSDAGLAPVAAWVQGRPSGCLDDKTRRVESYRMRDLLTAREGAVFQRLGEVPCLLSEPSTVDLQIAPADLLGRLHAYHDAGASASEADLFLALTRLDVSTADERLRDELAGLQVPVLLQSGKPMTLTAGPAASRYLADPANEPAGLETWWPGLFQWSVSVWKVEKESVPASLCDFPPRLVNHGADSAVFPTWGDTVVDLDTYEFNHGLGLQMRRAANRAAPLAPPAVLEFLAAGTRAHPAAVDDAARAVTEAWEHGLLRPSTPGVPYLNLDNPPGRLAATARALGEAAREGMLAVVWQILDDLAGVAAPGQCVATGAAEVVQTIAALLPEVLHAVAEGTADPAVLNLPGTRAMAARTGTSKAVTTAREVVAGISCVSRT